jgi:hypothetical protein
MNRFRGELAREMIQQVEPGARVLSNALHLEELRLAARGHFVSRWTVYAGVPHDFRAQSDAPVPPIAQNSDVGSMLYALAVDYDFPPEKRDYHRHPWADSAQSPLITREFRVRTFSLDPLAWWRPRRYENVLFAPDLENDFYRGPSTSASAPFWREVSAAYTLWRVP